MHWAAVASLKHSYDNPWSQGLLCIENGTIDLELDNSVPPVNSWKLNSIIIGTNIGGAMVGNDSAWAISGVLNHEYPEQYSTFYVNEKNTI